MDSRDEISHQSNKYEVKKYGQCASCVHTVVAHFAEFNVVVFFCPKKTYNRCLVLINWQHWRLRVDNSVCNHTRDWQIGLPLRGCPILLITRMITGWIGLHSVLLPILIAIMNNTKIPQWSLNVRKPSIEKFWFQFFLYTYHYIRLLSNECSSHRLQFF